MCLKSPPENFQIEIVESKLPKASRLPTGENETDLTVFVCSWSTKSTGESLLFSSLPQILTFLSAEVEARMVPSAFLDQMSSYHEMAHTLSSCRLKVPTGSTWYSSSMSLQSWPT